MSGSVGMWQPIETAPRDGRVLLFCPTEGGGYQTVGFWRDSINNEGEPGWMDGTVGDWRYEEYLVLDPTHWMPLPAPPVQERVS